MKNYLAAAGGDVPTGGITNPVLNKSIQNQTGLSFFQTIIPNFITLALVVGSLIFVFILITGAISWISSGGDKASVESARAKVTHALIGLVILFSVFAVIKLVEAIFGLKILTLDIAPLFIK
ncbi:hypothetical protein HYS03_00455 [Candidatus Woesebacteria bacterium]|nr:hypothetical protein [Candidatus Woesebacteria bacterium]QQG47639.1 MAG: hypothetical protein HY044_00955 [Candidatus Woesebacteria bacterium]